MCVCVCIYIYIYYIKRVNEKSYSNFATVVMVCLTFTVLLAFFFFFFGVNAQIYRIFAILFLVCPIHAVSHYNKILTSQIGTIFSQLLKC